MNHWSHPKHNIISQKYQIHTGQEIVHPLTPKIQMYKKGEAIVRWAELLFGKEDLPESH